MRLMKYLVNGSPGKKGVYFWLCSAVTRDVKQNKLYYATLQLLCRFGGEKLSTLWSMRLSMFLFAISNHYDNRMGGTLQNLYDKYISTFWGLSLSIQHIYL